MQEIYPYPDNADPLSIFGEKKKKLWHSQISC